jgi:hypothetical protein
MTRTELLRHRRQMSRRIREAVVRRRMAVALHAPPIQPLPGDDPPPPPE